MIEKNVQIALGGVLMTREAAKLAHELKGYAARVLLRPLELPIGVITSLAGSAAFVLIFYKSRRAR